jgi:hypothetical protein
MAVLTVIPTSDLIESLQIDPMITGRDSPAAIGCAGGGTSFITVSGRGGIGKDFRESSVDAYGIRFI